MALAHNISLKSSSWSQNRLLTYKKASRWKKTKKYGYKMPVIRALQYMPVSIREGTALTNCVCGTPFRTTCNKILARGTYPWYSMYTRKKNMRSTINMILLLPLCRVRSDAWSKS